MIRTWLIALVLALCAGDEKLAELKGKLTSGDARAKRSAVQELAELDTPDAWALVIGALGDVNAQVADEAQLQIAQIDDAPSLKLLLGKEGLEAKDAFVRLRVAEAFGRMSTPADPLFAVKPLGDKDAAVRRTAAWSIERQRGAQRWNGPAPAELFASSRRDKDAGVRAAALVALAEFASEGDVAPFVEAMDFALRSASFEERSAAVIAARKVLAADPTLRVELALMKDRHVGVRLCVAEDFAARKTRPAALQLVEMLASEGEARARWRMVDLLQGLSSLKHRLDPRPWRAWASALADDWSGEPTNVAAADEAPAEKTASFAGLPILSEHVTFLIDLSGSVWQARKDGKTRKQVIDEELRRALEALAPQVEFNVIPYTSQPIPWEKALVPASPKNVAKALEFFVGRKDTGTGNFWDALELALADPRVDTVVVLSDGAPTGGRRWNLVLMKQLFAEHNRFRRVVLEAVLADADGFLKREWGEMCASSGGRVLEIALK